MFVESFGILHRQTNALNVFTSITLIKKSIENKFVDYTIKTF